LSTHVPKIAALRPRTTMAIEKMMPIGVSAVPKWSASAFL